MRNLIAIFLLAGMLGGCAPLIVGTAAGVIAYRHECYRWTDTPYGLQRVWVCNTKPGRSIRRQY